MNRLHTGAAVLAAALLGNLALPAQAAIIISETDPSASGNTPYAADWFELTNTGNVAVDITGWRVDDNSNSFAVSRALLNVTSIAAHQTVVFIEATDLVAKSAAFINSWFAGVAPLGFAIGSYSGAGIGLSTNGDALNIFNGAGTLISRIDFVASNTGFTFDNAAGVNNGLVTQLSVAGVNGAFVSVAGETGSPGSVSAVPVPAAAWLFGSALAGMGALRRRRQG